jgi:hypothetical protein
MTKQSEKGRVRMRRRMEQRVRMYAQIPGPSSHAEILYIYIFRGFFFILYSALLHLPPIRFHCAGGCWDRTQDRCNFTGSQTLVDLIS